MNLRKLGRMSGMVAAVAMLAMVLQGCGGDDNGSNISQDMYNALQTEANAAKAALAAAEAEATEAKAAQATAEAAAKEAMAAEMEAKAAQATAEANVTAAVAAQAVAESETKAAMAAEMEAKAARATAEAEAKTAAATAAAAVTARATAELEAKAAKEAQAKAEMEAKEAMAAAETAKEEAAEAKTAAAVAQSEATEAKAAETEAKTAAQTAMAAAETAKKEAAAAKEEAEAAKVEAQMAKADRDRYKKMYEDATDVDTVGSTVGAAARAVGGRIQASVKAATKDSADMQGMMAMTKKGIAVKKLMRDDDGVSFSIMEGTVARMTSADAADDDAPSLSGWQGAALAATGGGVMQEALVYTDIDRSVATFGSSYPYTVDDTGAANVAAARTHYYVADLYPASAIATITLVDSTGGGGETNDKISIDYVVSSANTTQPVETTIRGSYDGVPGTYRCTRDCELEWSATGVTLVGKNEDGSELSGAAHLLFQADDVSALLPDPDYQTFGVWMIAQDGPAAAGYVRPIAMANASKFGQSDLRVLKGSATYNGQAAGYYTTRAAGSAEATAGRFTATATVSANFDAAPDTVTTDATNSVEIGPGHPVGLDEDRKPVALGTASVTDAAALASVMYFRSASAPGVSLKGKIDGFMAEDGTEMAGWVVNLGSGSIRLPKDVKVVGNTTEIATFETAQDTARTNGEAAGMFEGATSGTGYAMEWTGVWDASLHGNTMSNLPLGVVGTFQAEAGSAHPIANADGAIDLYNDGGFAGVVGSFGARR